MVKNLLKWGAGVLLGLFILAILGPGWLLIPFTLLIGWAKSAGRLLSNLDFDGALIAGIGMGMGLLIAGTHWFCAWVWSQRHASHNHAPHQGRWLRRWTLALHAGLWLVLLAIMGMVGVVHQAAWMIVSKEPMLISGMERLRARGDTLRTARALNMAAESNDWDLAKTQAAFWANELEPDKRSDVLWEKHHALFFEGPEGRLSAAVVFARDPDARGHGLVLIQPGADPKHQRAEALPAILARTGASSASPGKKARP